MESAETTPVLDGPQVEAEAEAEPGRDEATTLREAMLDAIGELSDEERERLGSGRQPSDMAHAWRDLIAERAAREREDTVRNELTREFQTHRQAGEPRPTTGLHGVAPASKPENVSEWADFIHEEEDGTQRQRRRDQFAEWLARHPNA